MKCPKCSFISFDYNEACPKCRHDLSHERGLMNLPSYKPKDFSLLGVLTGGDETSALDTPIGQSEFSGASGGGAEDLLISLDSLPDEGPEPIQVEPVPLQAAKETKFEEGAAAADDGLTISLEDLSDEEPELVFFSSEKAEKVPEVEIEDEAIFDPELLFPKEKEPGKAGFWETDDNEQTVAGSPVDDASKKDGVTYDQGKELPVKRSKKEPAPFELELQPLELDGEIEASDKKDF